MNDTRDRYDDELFALDQRIGQLALACRADLSRDEIVIALIKGRYEYCEAARDLDPRKREELRALLMMKYRIEASCVDSLGTDDCRRLLAEHEEKLRRRGFPPQSIADGT